MKSLVALFGLAIALILPVSTSAVSAENKVTVLYDGYVKQLEGHIFEKGRKSRRVATTVGLVEGRDFIMVTDPGMVGPGDWDGIISTLADKGIKPEDVTHVFITHHHPDHTTRLGAFPNAAVIDYRATYKDDLWTDHPPDDELLPGVTIMHTPGHAKEDATLLVETGEGVYAFTHLWVFPDYKPDLTQNTLRQDIWRRHRQTIQDKADWIVPGHGPAFKNTRK